MYALLTWQKLLLDSDNITHLVLQSPKVKSVKREICWRSKRPVCVTFHNLPLSFNGFPWTPLLPYEEVFGLACIWGDSWKRGSQPLLLGGHAAAKYFSFTQNCISHLFRFCHNLCVIFLQLCCEHGQEKVGQKGADRQDRQGLWLQYQCDLYSCPLGLLYCPAGGIGGSRCSVYWWGVRPMSPTSCGPRLGNTPPQLGENFTGRDN